MRTRYTILIMLLTLVPCVAAAADDVKPADAEQAKRFAAFEKLLSGAKLVGKFTVLGNKDSGLSDETYILKSVKKTGTGDYWLFHARVKYEDKDVTVPLPLEVKWAGDTPIVTLTDLAIPGLGTCSARVVFYNGKYAGTWTHGKAGGHLFGTIEREKEGE